MKKSRATSSSQSPRTAPRELRAHDLAPVVGGATSVEYALMLVAPAAPRP